MTLRAKHNGRLRVVSKAMARVLARRGVKVIDDATPIDGGKADTNAMIDEIKETFDNGTDAQVEAVLAKHLAPGAIVEVADEPMVDVVTEREAKAIETVKASGDPALGVLPGGEIVNVDDHLKQNVSVVSFESSNVFSAKLHHDTGVVEVLFKNGQTVRYGGFTFELLGEWTNAKSAGSWFHHNVKTKPDRHPILADEAKG